MEPILQLSEVETYYGQIHALKGIDLTVCAGEIVSLIGSNGAGKSTTLRTISGINKPRTGRIIYRNQEIQGLAPHLISGMGVAHVPEGRRIFPRMTVEENLEMGGYRFNDVKRIQRNMEEVYSLFPRLFERRDQKGGTLSGGEQQMLAIGRAMIGEPEILILDEPSMGLAPMMVENIFEIIKSINLKNIPILLVEQNANKALQVAHRGYVMVAGKIILQGTGKELLHNEEVREAYLG